MLSRRTSSWRTCQESVCLYSSDCKSLPVSIAVTDRFSHSHCNCGHFHTFFSLIKLAIIPSFSSALMSIRPFFAVDTILSFETQIVLKIESYKYDNLGFKHLQVNNIEPVSKTYIPCIHNKAIKGTTTPHFFIQSVMKRRKTRRRQCGKEIGTLFTTLGPKVLRVLGTKIIPALGLGAMEGLGRKMVGGRTLGKRTPCAMIRPQHLHKLKPYASMLRSKLNAKQIRALNSVRTHKRAAIIPLTKNQKGGFIGAMLASLGIPILMKALGIWFFAYIYFIFITLNAPDKGNLCVMAWRKKEGGSKHTGGKRKWNWTEVNKQQAEVHSLGPRTTPGTLYEVSHTHFTAPWDTIWCLTHTFYCRHFGRIIPLYTTADTITYLKEVSKVEFDLRKQELELRRKEQQQRWKKEGINLDIWKQALI